MTTPAKNTPYGIIGDAMLDAGKIRMGQEPTGEQLASYLGKLNDLVNYFMTKGIKLWLWTDQSVTLTASKQKYTIKSGGDVNITKPVRDVQAYYLDSNNIRRPLTRMSWNDWLLLGQVTQTGAINSYFIDDQQSEMDVYFWLIPDATAATGTAHILLQQQATNPISLTEIMNFPAEWRIALRWNLAWEICTGQPQTVIQRCKEMAQFYRTELEDFDVEEAPTSFAPDTRMTRPSRFR